MKLYIFLWSLRSTVIHLNEQFWISNLQSILKDNKIFRAPPCGSILKNKFKTTLSIGDRKDRVNFQFHSLSAMLDPKGKVFCRFPGRSSIWSRIYYEYYNEKKYILSEKYSFFCQIYFLNSRIENKNDHDQRICNRKCAKVPQKNITWHNVKLSKCLRSNLNKNSKYWTVESSIWKIVFPSKICRNEKWGMSWQVKLKCWNVCVFLLQKVPWNSHSGGGQLWKECCHVCGHRRA